MNPDEKAKTPDELQNFVDAGGRRGGEKCSMRVRL